jgi:hypothetical protein
MRIYYLLNGVAQIVYFSLENPQKQAVLSLNLKKSRSKTLIQANFSFKGNVLSHIYRNSGFGIDIEPGEKLHILYLYV